MMLSEALTTGQPIGERRFCEDCGTAVAGRFARNAVSRLGWRVEPEGTSGNSDAHATTRTPAGVAEEARQAVAPVHTPPAPPPGRERGGRRGLLIGIAIGGVALLAGAIVGAVLLFSGGSDAQKAYQQRLATAFGPVLGANHQLSNELTTVRGTRGPRARRRAAGSAGHHRGGGCGWGLNVPAGSEQLARDAHQALDREGAYNAAVASVLAHPSRTGAAQLQGLASNLTSALSEAGPTVSGTAQTVYGTDRLATWAPPTAQALRHRTSAAPSAPRSG